MRQRTNIVITAVVGIAIIAILMLRAGDRGAPVPLADDTPGDQEIRSLEALRARDLYPKPSVLACATGTMRIIDNLPDYLRHGVFQPGANFNAIVRFTNLGHDSGLALRLVSVSASGSADVALPVRGQDFLLLSRNDYPFADVAALADRARDKQAPLHGETRTYLTDVALSDARWWSITPYKLGPHAVKYTVRPCRGQAGSGRSATIKTIASFVKQSSLCFEFSVQVRNDSARMPVDDASVSWDEVLAPFEPIALVLIPAQATSGADDAMLCERLRFNPWRSHPAHAPLGSVNRARQLFYSSEE